MQSYTVILSPNEWKGLWSVVCPAMPAAASYGHDRDDALRNIAESMGAGTRSLGNAGMGRMKRHRI